MPIFQEDIHHPRPPPAGPQPSRRSPARLVVEAAPLGPRRLSEESLPVELCEGPIPDSPGECPETPEIQNELHLLDRSVLIERIKRGESPSWIPNRHVRAQSVSNARYIQILTLLYSSTLEYNTQLLLQPPRRLHSRPACLPRRKSPQRRIDLPRRYPIACTMASASSAHARRCTAVTSPMMSPPPLERSTARNRRQDTARTTSPSTWPGWLPPHPGHPCPLTTTVPLPSRALVSSRRCHRHFRRHLRISCQRARLHSPSPMRTRIVLRRRSARAAFSATSWTCPMEVMTRHRPSHLPSDHSVAMDVPPSAEKRPFPTRLTSLDAHPGPS